VKRVNSKDTQKGRLSAAKWEAHWAVTMDFQSVASKAAARERLWAACSELRTVEQTVFSRVVRKESYWARRLVVHWDATTVVSPAATWATQRAGYSANMTVDLRGVHLAHEWGSSLAASRAVRWASMSVDRWVVHLAPHRAALTGVRSVACLAGYLVATKDSLSASLLAGTKARVWAGNLEQMLAVTMDNLKAAHSANNSAVSMVCWTAERSALCSAALTVDSMGQRWAETTGHAKAAHLAAKSVCPLAAMTADWTAWRWAANLVCPWAAMRGDWKACQRAGPTVQSKAARTAPGKADCSADTKGDRKAGQWAGYWAVLKAGWRADWSVPWSLVEDQM
jgi:hypothetical protein